MSHDSYRNPPPSGGGRFKRIRLEKRAKEKAESKQFVADRKLAKELLAEHGEDLAHYIYIHWNGEEEPSLPKIRKSLKSDAWFNPDAVIDSMKAFLRKTGVQP